MTSTRVAGIAAAIACSLVFAAPAMAETRFVDDDGSEAPGFSGCTNPANPCATISGANGVSIPTDVIQIGGSLTSYAGSDLGSGVSLIETNFNPAITGENNGNASVDGGLSVGIIATSGAAREIRGLTIEGDAGAIEIQPDLGDITVSVIGNRFNARDTAEDSRVLVPSGAGTANVTIEDNAWTSPVILTTAINRVAIQDGTNGPVNAVVRNNSFDAVGSGMIFIDSDPTISGNTMTRVYEDTPAADHSAIQLVNSSAVVEGNSIDASIVGDGEVGIDINNPNAPFADTPVLRRNQITDFDVVGIRAQGDGIDPDTFTLTDSFIRTDLGSAVQLNDLSVGAGASLSGVTLLDGAGGQGFAIEAIDSILSLDSSTTAEDIITTGTGTCSITFSRGPTTSGGPCLNFQTSADPGLASATDFHLAAGSPLIDAGNPSSSTPFDLDGNARALLSAPACTQTAGRQDIGADEFVGATGVGCPTVAAPPQPTAAPKKCKKKKKRKKPASAAKKGCKKKKKRK